MRENIYRDEIYTKQDIYRKKIKTKEKKGSYKRENIHIYEKWKKNTHGKKKYTKRRYTRRGD